MSAGHERRASRRHAFALVGVRLLSEGTALPAGRRLARQTARAVRQLQVAGEAAFRFLHRRIPDAFAVDEDLVRRTAAGRGRYRARRQTALTGQRLDGHPLRAVGLFATGVVALRNGPFPTAGAIWRRLFDPALHLEQQSQPPSRAGRTAIRWSRWRSERGGGLLVWRRRAPINRGFAKPFAFRIIPPHNNLKWLASTCLAAADGRESGRDDRGERLGRRMKRRAASF